MFLNKMEAVIYNQDLFRHICGFLNPVDTLIIIKINKEIQSTANFFLPKYYGKILHLEKLKKNYDFNFLQDCVQNKLQAELLYKSFSPWYTRNGISYQNYEHLNYFYDLKGKMKQIYNLVRFKNWKKSLRWRCEKRWSFGF